MRAVNARRPVVMVVDDDQGSHQPRSVFLTAVDSSEGVVRRRGIRVRGGDIGARATIATLVAIRCGASVLYEADSSNAPDQNVIEATAATTLQGLAAVIRRPPIDLTALHRATTEAVHYVSRQYRDVNVATVAESVRLNASYLLQRFRSDLGLTPREYIARVRIEVVKQRLGEPGCPSLDRLAEEVGLCDAPHVHKLFARYAQGLPSGYRGHNHKHGH